jgi:hypothetical protein
MIMHLRRMLSITVKRSLILLLLVAAVTLFYYSYSFTGAVHAFETSTSENDKTEMQKLQRFALQAKAYCLKKGYNSKTCFLIDMNLPGGKNRFFVYDLTKDSVINAGIVAHGSCNQSFLSKPQFSNKPGCGCTALGKYKVGYKYKGRFGNAYKLYGLDSSNSNAFKRNIVLHSYYMVPDKETYPIPVCNSLGCAMVSDNYLCTLEREIDTSAGPILLWVFE